MVFCPDWPNRGLAWIEAFDNVRVMALLQTMVDLDLFRPTTIGLCFFMVVRRGLGKVFNPPKVTTVKPPRKVGIKWRRSVRWTRRGEERAPVRAGGFCLGQASFHRFTATIVFLKERVTWQQVL